MFKNLAQSMVRIGCRNPVLKERRLTPVLLRAPGRMFSLQKDLPKLPVPALEQTLNKFLLSIRPTVSDEEFSQAQKIVQDFGRKGGPGENLQRLLEEKARSTINWLSEYWINVAYLDYRLPVTIHSNPGILCPQQDFRDTEGQLRAAAKLISGVLDFKVMIDNESLPVEYLGGKPLCMMQFYKVFASCRIPGKKRDSIVNYPPDQPDAPKHIIIAHNNHLFSVNVYGTDGRPLTMEQLYEQLRSIVDRSQHEALPLGVLTAENRNSWGKTYAKIIKDKQNLANMKEIQRAIFMVCIDGDKPMPAGVDVDSFFAGQMNHGWGSKGNSGNRWFDKTMQFIVGPNGAVGMNYEHAPAEGPPILSVIDHMVKYMKKSPPQGDPVPGMMQPQRLKFSIEPDVEKDIEKAMQGLDSTISDLDLTVLKFNEFGKEFIKGQKVSPDAFIQVCLQLAFYRLHGRSPTTYESGSLRAFQLGRTDTIRSCSIASHHYCQVMMDGSSSTEQRMAALRNAIGSHRSYTNDVVKGQGIDRHLLGLKLVAIENGMDVPDFFMDPLYTSSVHWEMSTSQVASSSNAVLVFGPVVPNGYGVCYNPMSHGINFAVSAWNSSPETDSKQMIASINQSLTETQDTLLRGQKLDAKL